MQQGSCHDAALALFLWRTSSRLPAARLTLHKDAGGPEAYIDGMRQGAYQQYQPTREPLRIVRGDLAARAVAGQEEALVAACEHRCTLCNMPHDAMMRCRHCLDFVPSTRFPQRAGP